MVVQQHQGPGEIEDWDVVGDILDEEKAIDWDVGTRQFTCRVATSHQ